MQSNFNFQLVFKQTSHIAHSHLSAVVSSLILMYSYSLVNHTFTSFHFMQSLEPLNRHTLASW